MLHTYNVEMQEVRLLETGAETVEIWDDFFDTTSDYDIAVSNAKELATRIKSHDVSEVREVKDKGNIISVCIAEYDEENSIVDVETVENIQPSEWN